ncbi:hypothetical protein [Chromohalobacter sp. 296-RDG]|uniref:hypothetical protein n=1 Tax=Chromohalobacter sp. 296-RDG TaxID=2994062 RepID=UPI0024682D87|nr:hypothetical protein [Chromohalobacter sp. 296-RDG]
MPQIFINNARGVLAASVPSGETSLKLKNGVNLPSSLADGDWFLMTLLNDASRYGSNIEVVKVTAITDDGGGNHSLTVDRGYEGDAIVHAGGEKVEARLTAQTLRTLLSDAKAYADAEISRLVDSAPGALDTLNELSSALNDDPDFAASVTNTLAEKLDSSSYTAADVLTKLLTVDGEGSGLSADTLDGKHLAQLEQDYRDFSVAVTPTAFTKSDGSRAAWTAPTVSTLVTTSSLSLVVGPSLVTIAGGTDVALPALSPGTDYTIYAHADGTLEAVDADSAAPSDTRAVGGFHASAGAGDIVTASLWDLNWRPDAHSPRGMVRDPKSGIWADIYLMDTQYGVNGYSRNGAQIADDNDRPVTPDEYGGNGSDTYGSMSWWVAVDLAMAAGKRLPFYQEFTALAYGVVERQAVGSDPGTTQHQAGHRSACGCEQITGTLWQWGADINGTSATGSSSWKELTEGRGDIYTNSIRSPRFGAGWNGGSLAGSRASDWNNRPDYSGGRISARGVCDHMNLQAER